VIKTAESLQSKIKDQYLELSHFKNNRNELNREAKKLAEKRRIIYERIKVLRTEADSLKAKRDEINEKVKELKGLREQNRKKRDEKRKKIFELTKKLGGLQKKTNLKSLNEIENDIKNLEWELQTTTHTLEREKHFVNQVRVLEIQRSTLKKIQKIKDTIMELRTEEKENETNADTYHMELLELADQGQKLHQRFSGVLNEGKILRKKADEIQQRYKEVKEQSRTFNKKCATALQEIVALKQELQRLDEEKKARCNLELHERLRERAQKKLKLGEKLTWEEFKVLAESGVL
jgi:uncharacterized coiled-coil DUF342 family protein